MSDTGLRPIDSFTAENQPLVAALRSGDDTRRLVALEDLCEADDELGEELLRILLSDASESFRADVAIALGPTLELCDDELDENGRLAIDVETGPRSRIAKSGRIGANGVRVSQAMGATGFRIPLQRSSGCHSFLGPAPHICTRSRIARIQAAQSFVSFRR